MPFEKNVFINCPFDNEYKPLLKAIIFLLVYLDLEPLISETVDSTSFRLGGIKEMIGKSKFGIHDLSRCEPMDKGDLPRFNMPFELGLDLGARDFATTKRLKSKKILVLEKEKYRYQQVLSDLSGCDINSHGDDPEKMIRTIRNWLSHHLGHETIVGGGAIWGEYQLFLSEFEVLAMANGHDAVDIEEMSRSEYISYVKSWSSSG